MQGGTGGTGGQLGYGPKNQESNSSREEAKEAHAASEQTDLAGGQAFEGRALPVVPHLSGGQAGSEGKVCCLLPSMVLPHMRLLGLLAATVGLLVFWAIA